jgi:hypothetical protein
MSSFKTINSKSGITFVLMLLFSVSVLGCELDISPLRKQFRHASNVFIGEVIDVMPPPTNIRVPKNREVLGIVEFRIDKSWKGVKSGRMRLMSNVFASVCGHSYQFEKGGKYLVFAEKDYAHTLGSWRHEYAEPIIKKLDNPWYRFMSTVYLF